MASSATRTMNVSRPNIVRCGSAPRRRRRRGRAPARPPKDTPRQRIRLASITPCSAAAARRSVSRSTQPAASAPPPGARGHRARPPQREAGGAVERLVRCPSRLRIRLITASGRSDSTLSRHLPAPSPSAPSRPSASPDSSSGAHSLRNAPAGSVSVTASTPARPASSVPVMVTSAASDAERFTSSSTLA